MSLTLSATDAYPYLCGVYTCACGRSATRHGRLAATLPPGWELREGREHDTTHVCDHCAGRTGRRLAAGSAP